MEEPAAPLPSPFLEAEGRSGTRRTGQSPAFPGIWSWHLQMYLQEKEK